MRARSSAARSAGPCSVTTRDSAQAFPRSPMLDASYAVLDEEAWYRLRPGAACTKLPHRARRTRRPAWDSVGMPEPNPELSLNMAPPSEQQTISRASVGLRSERGPILLSVMLSVGL